MVNVRLGNDGEAVNAEIDDEKDDDGVEDIEEPVLGGAQFQHRASLGRCFHLCWFCC